MAKYRKTVLVDAEPYRKGMEDGFLHGEHCLMFDCDRQGQCAECEDAIPFINTLEGSHIITPTDMILTGIKGERWPVKKDIFDLTYEKVSD